MNKLKTMLLVLTSMIISSLGEYKLDDLITLVNYYQLNLPVIYFKSKSKLIEELTNYFNLFNSK